MRSVAVNVGANTNEPGFRAPIRKYGDFEYVPIPESEPTSESVPTYGDLDLRMEIPESVRETPVHFDPEWPELDHGEAYTYGDPFGVKATPLLELSAGDFVFFYATLDAEDDRPGWQAPDWGAYLIGHFRLAQDPLSGEAYQALSDAAKEPFSNNAHVKREAFDARVMLLGDPWGSKLYREAVPLSSRERGVDANRIVTDLSSDSGKGPWWRRVLRFGSVETEELLEIIDTREYDRCFEE
ncbi:hypothetical protein [Natronomonas sp. EA1]|uniref:Nmad3 family putative nucleotide modification protein n=1 Tax=Natronomonas sp. EA1 TaxID=3421655 RepID=UPI003EBD38B3